MLIAGEISRSFSDIRSFRAVKRLATMPNIEQKVRPNNSQSDTHADWRLDPKNYTMEFVNARVNQFFSEKANEADFKYFLLLRICGYSSGHLLPEVWQVGR